MCVCVYVCVCMCVCVYVCVCMCVCVSAYVLEQQFSLPHRGDVLHTIGTLDCKDYCQSGSSEVIKSKELMNEVMNEMKNTSINQSMNEWTCERIDK